jgi:hypothetical protein
LGLDRRAIEIGRIAKIAPAGRKATIFMTMATWSGDSQFDYSGSVATGTDIHYGTNTKYRIKISESKYAELLTHFGGQEVLVGTNRVKPPSGSLGEWLKKNVTQTASASYVAPILVQEGYAVRASDSRRIRFVPRL